MAIRTFGVWKNYLIGGALFFIVVRYISSSIDSPSNCGTMEASLDCFNGTAQDDPELIRIIRHKYIFPPPTDNLYHVPPWKAAELDQVITSDRLSKVVEILKPMSPGFFIECGALDGIMASNTLWLEKILGWTGLLVEANPMDFLALAAHRRRSWISNVCLSSLPYPNKVTFYVQPPEKRDKFPGTSGMLRRDAYNTNPIEVECLPLYSILLALNRTTIDYFSLDVEGSELNILNTIPFDNITFKVLNIENWFIQGGHTALAHLLEGKGYVFYQFAPDAANGHSFDSIFLHSSLPQAQKLLAERNYKNSCPCPTNLTTTIN